MPNFNDLEFLNNEFDFSQLRALDGCRATNESIVLFISKLNNFFEQFKEQPPSQNEINHYQDIMSHILNKINIIEMEHASKKVYHDDEGNPMSVDLENYKVSLKTLPQRMQYWAASKNYGDSIRNSQQHAKAVKCINHWNIQYVMNKSLDSQNNSIFSQTRKRKQSKVGKTKEKKIEIRKDIFQK